jgi:predicted permease
MRLRDRLTVTGRRWNQPFVTWLQMIGRVQPGVSWEAARTELNGIYRQAHAEFAATADANDQRIAREAQMQVRAAATGLAGGVRTFAPALRLLMGVAAAVLLVACANIANLLLARSEARKREIAIRLGLGASRARLARQFLTESALVGALGGTLGLALAAWGASAMVKMVSAGPVPVLLDTTPDLRVLGFTGLSSLATILLFSLAPAVRATQAHPNAGLYGLRAGAGTARLAWNRTLVAGQVALSLVLVFAAGLLVRTVDNLLSGDPGYNRQNVLMFSTDASLRQYDAGKAPALYGSVLDALNAIPGVSRASASFVRPIDSGVYMVGGAGFVEDRTLAPDGRVPFAFNVIAPGYFSTLEVPLLTGRDFGPQDTARSPKVAIINETMARALFPGERALGRRFGQNAREVLEIVGVVEDTKYANLRDAARALVYFPISQTPWPSQVTFLLRHAGAVGPIAGAVRQRLAAIDPTLPMYGVNTLEVQARQSLLKERLLARVSALFGLAALLLAAVGLYGLMSFAVARRDREIGVRMALGAQRRAVVWMTLREALQLTLTGIVVGVPCAIVFMRVARAFLFGLAPFDPLTLTTAVAVLTVVGLVAGYVPARRASRVDPMVALRVE